MLSLRPPVDRFSFQSLDGRLQIGLLIEGTLNLKSAI
jgi:hypothetical protein